MLAARLAKDPPLMGEAVASSKREDELQARLARRYAHGARATRSFVYWKLRLDPVHAAVFAQAVAEPLGQVADLGCGRGQFGIALLELGLAQTVTGIDWDTEVIAVARSAGAGLAATFVAADLRNHELPEAHCMLLIDLLYQVPAEAQRDLLLRAAAATRDRLFIRALDPQQGWRSRVGRVAERISALLRLYRPAVIEPTPVATFMGWLEAAGFACTVAPCWGWTPFPNVLLVARRLAPGPGAGRAPLSS